MRDVSDTPKFDNPPVFETLLGVQFRALPGIRNAHYGLLWEKLRQQGFVNIEEHPPLIHVLEQQEQQTRAWTWTLSLGDPAPQTLRQWYLSDESSEGQRLIQVQNDRFIVNWRRKSLQEAQYPSYDENKQEFKRFYEQFGKFIEDEALGVIAIDQAEMVYINQIPFTDDCDTALEMMAKCFPAWVPGKNEQYKFGTNTSASNNLSFWIDELAGKLYIETRSVTVRDTKEKVLDLRLTTRGRPQNGDNKSIGLEQLMRWFDLSHYIITSSFANVTSKSMHEIWRRKK